MDSKRKGIVIVLIVIFIVVLLGYLFYQPANTNSNYSPNRYVINVTYLPLPVFSGNTSVETAIENRRSVRSFSAESLNLTNVSQILWAAQGITDNDSNLRSVPSAGQVYPLEIYIVTGQNGVSGLSEGVYLYVPSNNTLEKTVNGDVRSKLSTIADGQNAVAQAPVDLVITGNYPMMINKYHDKDLCTRFVDLEAGHAGENIYLQAESLGLVTVAIGSFNEVQMKQLLEIPQNETPLYIFPIGHES